MSSSTGAWRTFMLLLRTANVRARGRRQHQQRLVNAGSTGSSSASALLVLAALVAALMHGTLGFLLTVFLTAGNAVQAEQAGHLVLSARRYQALVGLSHRAAAEGVSVSAARIFAGEGRHADAADPHAYETYLEDRYQQSGLSAFEREPDSTWLAHTPALLTPVASWLGSSLCVLWFVLLAFQGEGVDLDVQRRRHPMHEWLFSHPVPPSAVFLSEMLAPLAANPMFWMAPLYWIVLYTIAYDNFGVGLYAGIAVGVPLAAAAGCVGKAIEIFAQFRLPPRSRGALLGVLGWLGYVAMACVLFLSTARGLVQQGARLIGRVFSGVRLPLLSWLLGLGSVAEESSAWRGVAVCLSVSLFVIAAATYLCIRATRLGLAGAYGLTASSPVVLAARSGKRWRDPIFRKELIWLSRDRGAWVQVFLIPLTIIGMQLLNLRQVMRYMTWSWNVVAGVTVVFGANFIQVLGPRSLTSEGSALWIALTWPRGLDDMLKAKARLWWLVTLAIVLPVLLVAAVIYPADWWRLLLVMLVWALHGYHLAQRAVTLVRVPSSSGELEPLPRGKQWAASVGTLVVGVGLMSSQWNVVVTGVVYTLLVAAAQWQSFRAHAPYLFDPWSEKLPAAPTLSQAMLACYGLVEAMAVFTALLLLAAGRDHMALARSGGYALSAMLTGLITNTLLHNRGVSLRDIVGSALLPRLLLSAVSALVLGVGLGLAARSYVQLVQPVAEQADPSDYVWTMIMAVLCAPIAEEYLFRGLLFRALRREWGEARAIWGSALFFAIYHPPLAWLPVGLVGALSAWVFARSGHLLPSVVMHMAYNAVVLGGF